MRKSLKSMALNVRMKYEDAITEYLLDIGDTETQIENIRRILLDKPTILVYHIPVGLVYSDGYKSNKEMRGGKANEILFFALSRL